MKDEISKMEARHKKIQREFYTREDEIDEEKEWLQDEVQQKLHGNCVAEHIMMIGFEIV